MEEDLEMSRMFPGEDNVDLYDVLALKSDVSQEDIKKSYRKLALLCHPDKHTNSSEHERAHALKRFQQIGFAYAILSDEKRREKYDRTGTTGESLVDPDDDGGWDAYFQDLFDYVTCGRLDEMKKEYQGSSEEVEDLMAAYREAEGSLGEIMNHIPHSTADDEPRFIHILSKFIVEDQLPDLPLWRSTSSDEKAKLVRKKQAEKEANEAEELAKELGVWDEFYGSGKVGARKGKGKHKEKEKEKEKEKDDAGDEEDVSALQALILQRQQARNGFLDNLAAKYMEEEETSRKKGAKGKKRKKATEPEDSKETASPQKKPRSALPEIDEEKFENSRLKPTSRKAKASGKRETQAKKAV
ncbi:hypothetical protein J3R82DRAFT_5652 [Butyriboletus roseoflavus]|nr:hypothetical protein J3R82DRAFT_5652 [Butyriboletus roseoflavus]